eukprot:PhF_6_TR3958/c0_g1_i1/m.5510
MRKGGGNNGGGGGGGNNNRRGGGQGGQGGGQQAPGNSRVRRGFETDEQMSSRTRVPASGFMDRAVPQAAGAQEVAAKAPFTAAEGKAFLKEIWDVYATDEMAEFSPQSEGKALRPVADVIAVMTRQL